MRWTLAVFCLAVRGTTAHAACEPSSIRVDPSLADAIGPVVIVGSIGQTFFAQDTIVTTLTIWRAPHGGLAVSFWPRIVATDSTGRPDLPILWEGPHVQAPMSDSLPAPNTWAIDPPLVLPRRGLYAWYVCSGDINFLAVSGSDPIPEGHAWRECRGQCGPVCRNAYPYDLVFDMTFCRDASTPARRSTWGRLKSIYR